MISEFKGEHSWLSNFEPVKITLKGVTYPSVEHAYMSAKSDDPKWKSFCSDAKNTPGKVKRESRKIQLPKNWDASKRTIMGECLVKKFTQEPFKSKLLDTKDQCIEEGNTWGDRFWGVDLITGKGENVLGEMIMIIRDFI